MPDPTVQQMEKSVGMVLAGVKDAGRWEDRWVMVMNA